MIKFLKIIIFYFVFISFSLANEDIYNTDFININIKNEIIADAKNKKIEEIKNFSFENILKRILSKNDYDNIKRNIIQNTNINFFIKNIIIENEFISKNKYYADIKINFDKKEIINFLRNKKINYTDLESDNILIICIEKNKLSQEGLTINNSFYNNFKIQKYELINFIYPELSLNDRFIAPYKKIINNDIISLKKLSKKYKVEYLLIIKIDLTKNYKLINIDIYNTFSNKIENIDVIELPMNSIYQNDILEKITEWWKSINIINNSDIKSYLCTINSSNMYEIMMINSKINSISQVKSNILQRIDYGQNLNNLMIYGNFDNLSKKLLNYNININVNTPNECEISKLN